MFYSLELNVGEASKYQDRMKQSVVLIFLIVVAMTFSVQPTYASVPTIHSMEMDRAGSDVIVTIEIAHQLGSESHYVDIVETTMGGRTLNFTNLVHQTSYRFFVNGTYNNTDIGELRVRAHCVTHGWSNWRQIILLGPNVASKVDLNTTTASSTSTAHIWSLEEMTEKADVILVGNVESITHHPADPNDVPKMHRKVQISVEYYLKNPLNSSEVIVLLLGGTVGNTTMYVTSQPEFYESDRVLLFLREDVWFLEENPKGYYGVDGEQGKIKIFADTDMSDFGFNVTNIFLLPSKDAESRLTDSAPEEIQKRDGKQPWYPLAVPLIMMSLLVLMKWRKMIP